MTTMTSTPWAEQNQAALVREFAALRQRFGGSGAKAEQPYLVGQEEVDRAEEMERPAAIDELTRIFGLSGFERELLLLCAGVEMESALADRCGELVARPPRCFVTFALAMGVLRDPHWSALAPTAPLRRYRLIEMESGHGFTTAPLHIDERILHYLAGVNELDQRLEGMLTRRADPVALSEEHWRLAQNLLANVHEMPVTTGLHLFGDDPQGQESIAALLANRAGRALFVLRMDDTPAAGAESGQFLALWTREALLLPAMLLLQWESDTPAAGARRLAERLPGPLVIATRDPMRPNRTVEQYEVNKAGPAGQREMWQIALRPASQEARETVDQIAQQFRLSAETIAGLASTAAARAGEDERGTGRPLWASCRAVARPRLESLAERIVASAGWHDLILPELQTQMLRQLVAQSRHRMTVYEDWGFAACSRRGLGLSALFSGASGTGKTLAAEVIAAELHLDMYRIDLSAVVSKYIGETEKNLKQVFDAAETGGVLLLFDEADALFGKRAEVKDSHDRYANIEVGYLLQRMESFQGLAILTTNVKSTLDKAFQRRLRFSVDFPFPNAAQREAIWARAFPPQTPTVGLDTTRLASLNMAGGNIRNIAINAAFFAAEEGSAVRMAHVLQATRMEAAKAERPLVEAEIRGWL
jgi:predicted nucleic acid-binding protein